METSEMNRRATYILEDWNPFAVGEQFYVTEVAAVLEELLVLDDPSELARKIQGIYKLSFEHWIPLEKCVEVSYKLIALKYEAKRII